MARLSAKLRSTTNGVAFWCPGCDGAHVVNTGRNGWLWNGDAEKPTLMPSVLVTYSGHDADQGCAPPARCHSFVENGEIRFLGDSTHGLSGRTVPLPDWPHQEDDYG